MTGVPAPAPGLFIVPPSDWPRIQREIPLTGVQIHAKVIGPAARVRVQQTYTNHEQRPVESVYVFPLEERAAVCGFAITIDGKRVVGQVKEREKAFDDYDNAMLEGHGAFLLDQERPNIFTASVGNLMPGQTARIEIDYVAELDRTDEGLRLMIPTTVSPRYVPRSMQDVEGQESGDRVNPPVATDGVPYGLKLTVEADLLSPIRSIESPSHQIRSEIDGNCVRVELAGDDRSLDKDFVLLLKPSEASLPFSGLFEGPEGERFVVASFRPEIECERSPVEVLFLVDCSGSMDGSSMEEARRTLRLCLRSLMPGDRFNLVRFGSDHESIFTKSQAYDEESLTQADRVVEQMQADLGGTEILTPLSEMLAEKPAENLPRRVVLLTDGQVANENDVIALARQHRDTTRIYAFGIGSGASEHLIRGLARASNGAAEFVAPGEKIEDKVLRHFKRLALPVASGVRLEWEGLEVEDVVPQHVPSFGPGDTLTVLARVTSGESGTVRLAGEIAGRPIEALAEIGAASAKTAKDLLLPVLWARRKIQQLEEGDVWTARQGSRQATRVARKRKREKKLIAEELVRLGERYCLVSSVTSFVAIEERDEADRAEGRAEYRQIPVGLTRGWGGRDMRVARSTRSLQSQSLHRVAPGICFSEIADSVEFNLIERDHPTTRGVSADPTPMSDLYQLLLQQKADGAWELTEDLATLCDCGVADFQKLATQCPEPWASKVLATLLVLELTERHGAPESWEAILDKSLAWVVTTTGQTAPPNPHATWKEWARQIWA